jgi:hypothetical protein
MSLPILDYYHYNAVRLQFFFSKCLLSTLTTIVTFEEREMGKFLWLIVYLCINTITLSNHVPLNEKTYNSYERGNNDTKSINIKRNGKVMTRMPMKTSRRQINEQKPKSTKFRSTHTQHRHTKNLIPRNPKPRLTNWYKKWSHQTYNRPNIKNKQFVAARPRPRPPFLPFRLTPASFLIPAIPTLVGKGIQNKFAIDIYYIFSGLGAGLAWVASQQVPITTTISEIGSPSTNVTITQTNTNTPTITQTQTNTATATNTNNDSDTISSSSTNTVTNTNTNNARRK